MAIFTTRWKWKVCQVLVSVIFLVQRNCDTGIRGTKSYLGYFNKRHICVVKFE